MYSAKLAAVHAQSDMITVQHLMKAAKSTRPSVSPADRRRFLKIYAKYRDEENGVEQSGGGGGGETKFNGTGMTEEEQRREMLGKLASFGYDVDDIKKTGKQRLATA